MATQDMLLGNNAKVRAVWTDPDNDDAPFDPTNVYVTIRDPDGNVTSYTYGASTIVKVSVGIYTYTWTPDEAGHWYYRWHSSPEDTAAEGLINVTRPHAV